MKIKTGDTVRITAGKEKGKEGKVIQVFPDHNRLVVEGVNTATRHLRASRGKAGQKITYASPLHVSNAQIISSKSGKIGRVGYKRISESGSTKKIRVLRSKGQSEDIE